MGTKHYRSRRAALAALSDELRGQGWSWAQIAARVQLEQRVNARVAMRLVHNLSQQDVADRWNERFPSAQGERPLTAKKLSYWETWPESGREPTLTTLGCLAQIYDCETKDLIDSDRPSVTDSLPVPHPRPEAVRLVAPQEARPFTPSESLVVPEDVHLPNELAALLLQQLDPLSAGPISARQRDAAFGQLIQFLTAWAHTMNRRDILRILGWAAIAASSVPFSSTLSPDEEARTVEAVAMPQRIDASLIDHMEQVLWIAKCQDDTRGPRAALDPVLAQRNLIHLMLSDCPSPLRPRLLSLYASASRISGWLSFDCNDFESAEYYYEHARATAHEAQNTELGAHVLCNMSHLETWRGRPRIGIDHAVAAQAWAAKTTNYALRAYAADVAARAYATDGEYNDCMQALDEAQSNLHNPDVGSSLLHFSYDGTDSRCGPAFLTSVRGVCLLRLDRPRDALAAAEESLRLLRPSYVRNVAMTKLDLGLALTKLGEIDGAANAIGEAGDLAARNHSTRTIEQVQAAGKQMEPWRHTPAVRDLYDRLSSYQN